ncbi:MAG: MCE family protein [Sphingobacteriia bacterium]|nr:MAG: MCE family protein [Sphingobacteriia bacterium]
MQVSNETKVGALAAVAITFLILGFNFLKGKSLVKTGNFVYAKYTDTKSIMVSNPVYIKGFQVGAVADIENADAALSEIIVSIKLKEAYQIPKNSYAVINSNPLGTSSIAIVLGNAKDFLKPGDTLATKESPGLLGGIMDKISPVAGELEQTIHTLDSVLKNINTVFDPKTKNNLQAVVANVNLTTASLVNASARLQAMMDQQNGVITQSMNNVNSFTKNLSENNQKITQTIDNLQASTKQLAGSDIQGTVKQLQTTIGKLNETLTKINQGDGSLAKLMNDKELYKNLNNTVRSANILLDDLRTHPKRYVNVSVFGRKDKSTPLSAPLADSLPKQP